MPKRGYQPTEIHRKRLSEALTGRELSEEHKRRMSEARKEWLKHNDHSSKGRKHSEEEKQRIAEAGRLRWQDPDHRERFSKKMKGRTLSEEHRRKLSEATKEQWANPEMRAKMCLPPHPSGEDSPTWQGGKSFEPYCPKFNRRLKEVIRNRGNRTCVLCGKSEIQNGKRLSVHHIDSDKSQGCNGVKWHLCALCSSCNAKPDTVEKEFLIITNPVNGGS